MKTLTRQKFVACLLSVAIPLTGTTVAYAQPESDTVSGVYSASGKYDDESILKPVSYNMHTRLYEYDVELAVENGVSRDDAERYRGNIESLSREDVRSLNEAMGFDPSEYLPVEEGVSFRPLPAFLVPLIAAIGRGAVAAIAASVAKYGISETCKRLQGKWGAFDDYCKSNGWQ